MIGINVGQLEDRVGEVKATVRKVSKHIVSRMARYQRAVEMKSMLSVPHEKDRGNYAQAGTPPYTHPRTSKAGNKMKAFPDFILYDDNAGTAIEPRAVVGPTKRINKLERIGHTHEFGGTYTVEKRVYRGKDRQFRTAIDHIPLYSKGEKTFPFTILEHRKPRLTKQGKPYKNDKEFMHISYRATYPKRPFAAPALRKTIAATRQGKFG